ncbi:MAG: hypothetical protein EP343_30580 [Deltaproteobacteria bacterium]|nr:MAG: hypothetical protein EP343_30580 [Deltaproteobacteria bacterium]
MNPTTPHPLALWGKRFTVSVLLLVLGAGVSLLHAGCNPKQLISRLETWEGPSINTGRMSASLGGALLKDGRLVIVGGSNKESPFVPVSGKQAIEVADSKCILSAECKRDGANCKCWKYADIDLKYGIGGAIYPLPDGRLIGFSSVFVFDRESYRLDPKPINDKSPTSGSVSAVIIDIDKKEFIPIYRPEENTAGRPSINKADKLALMQRAFERSLQLKDGRIIRVGGHVIYKNSPPTKACEQGLCHYCVDQECEPSSQSIVCTEENFQTVCPFQEGSSKFTVLNDIEIYTPPDDKNPKGSVRVLKMDTARSSVGAIEMANGKILITGGWGPTGFGPNENYLTTYILDPNQEGAGALIRGPDNIDYREDHAMTVLADGRTFITGGTDHNGVTINTTEYFDPKTGVFRDAPEMTIAREDHVPMILGPWLLFIGGESTGKSDLVHNSVEIFNVKTGKYIGPKFLFSAVGTKASQTGVTDFAAIKLNDTTGMIIGGQQGQQDRDGEYVSSGVGSNRTLLFQYQASN